MREYTRIKYEGAPFYSSSGGPKGILDVLHSCDSRLLVDEYTDHVESVLHVGPAVPRDPDQRGSRELALLAMVYRGHGIAIFIVPTCLDFDEGDRVPALDYEIDVAMAGAETTVNDRPPADHRPPLSHTLSAGAELLSLRKHGGNVLRSPGSACSIPSPKESFSTELLLSHTAYPHP